MGRSTDPHVSAPQWTSPDAKSAVSIPATGMESEEESHMEKKIWDQETDNAFLIPRIVNKTKPKYPGHHLGPYVAADTIARVSSLIELSWPYTQFYSIIHQHRHEHTLTW